MAGSFDCRYSYEYDVGRSVQFTYHDLCHSMKTDTGCRNDTRCPRSKFMRKAFSILYHALGESFPLSVQVS